MASRGSNRVAPDTSEAVYRCTVIGIIFVIGMASGATLCYLARALS